MAAGAYSSTAPIYNIACLPSLQNQFDQINIMTYDLSGPYEGWVTWFNSPIYDGGYRFPSTGGLIPSVNGAVSNFVVNGVSPAPVGHWHRFLWRRLGGRRGTSTGGATQPRQSWTTAPTMTSVDYSAILASYYQTVQYHWDTNAQAAWLSITNANPSDDMFISYDDQRTCQSKVSYARNNGLGGVMIWELSQDFQKGQPQPLLAAVKQAIATPGPITILNFGAQIELNFLSIPLGSYSVEWESNLAGGDWNTLMITNVPGTGGVIQVFDPRSPTPAQRFYRVQTPP